MTRFYHMTMLALATLSLVGCGHPTPVPPEQTAIAPVPQELLSHLVERYWEENAAGGPWYSWGGAETRYGEAPADAISPQALADSLAMERRYLEDLSHVARAPLDADAKLTYDMFQRERELAIEGFTYPAELLPVNAFDSMPQRFALMAAAAERQALTSDRDFDVWRSRAQIFARWTEQAIANLREGMRRGYTLPLPVVSRTLPMLAALSEDGPNNVFYQALNDGTGTGAGADNGERARLREGITAAVKDRILPAYRELHTFLQREYLPRARNTVGLSALPLGDAWYAHRVRRATDGNQSPADLHGSATAEMERLHGRLLSLLGETPFAGNAQGYIDSLRGDPRYSYRTADELLSAYRAMKTQVAAAVPTLLSVAPHGDFEIRGVETFRLATSPPAFYQRAMAAGRHSAILYVDTADLQARPAIAIAARYLREAVPGHHYQLALQQEHADLPRFRRFGGAPAFIEGWGLYAASLGEELGIYRDPQAKFGALMAQLECVAGTVIDTGIHAQQWTRVQALEYLHAHLPLDDATAANEVDRVLALPGDALSCLAGYSKIQGLRAHAQQSLGSRFDPQAFHAELLRNGALPLDLLEADMKQWMVTAATAPPPPPPPPGPVVPAPGGQAGEPLPGGAATKVEWAPKLE